MPPGKKDSSKSLITAKLIPQKIIIVINCLFIMMYKIKYYEKYYHYYFFNSS